MLALARAPVRFNIEIKLNPNKPDEYADAESIVKAVLEQVKAAGALNRVMIQSFNWQPLQIAQRLAPAIPTGYLTLQNPRRNSLVDPAWTAGFLLRSHGSAPKMVKAAGGKLWTPNFEDLSPELVKEGQALGLSVIPWTVNEPADMERLIGWGVDGLITDYPDRARTVMRARGMALPASVLTNGR